MRNFCQRIAALTLGAALFHASPALALFDAQLLVGQRSGDYKIDDGDKISMKGREIQLAAHIDPIPLVPVAFGLYLMQPTWDDINDDSAKKLTGLEAGLEVYAWFPLAIASLRPYVKFGLPVYGAHKLDYAYSYENELLGVDEQIDAHFVLETKGGYHLHFGLAWQPAPLVSLLFEANISQQRLESKEFKLPGEPIPGMDPINIDINGDYNSTAFLVGVQVGI